MLQIGQQQELNPFLAAFRKACLTLLEKLALPQPEDIVEAAKAVLYR